MLEIIALLMLATAITVFFTGLAFLHDYDKIAQFLCYVGFVEISTIILLLIITLIQILL